MTQFILHPLVNRYLIRVKITSYGQKATSYKVALLKLINAVSFYLTVRYNSQNRQTLINIKQGGRMMKHPKHFIKPIT